MNTLEQRIITIVESARGINGRVLLARLSTEFLSLPNIEIKHSIMNLVENEEIMEVEYVIGNGPSESLFLPINTRIEVSR